MGTPGDKRSGPVESRFRDVLERRRAESEGKSIVETLSEAGEEMDVGNTPEQKPAEKDFTTQELLQHLTVGRIRPHHPLTSSPRKNLELPLTSKTSNMGMILLSAKESKKNAFEGKKWMFLITLDKKALREFLSEFNQKAETEPRFKEELWDTMVKFGKPVLMGTGLDEKARKELLSKIIKLQETEQKTKDDECKDSSTLKQKTDNKMIKVEKEDKVKTSNMIKDINILKARERVRQESERAGPGQRGRISDDSGDTPKQRCEVSKEEKGGRRVE